MTKERLSKLQKWIISSCYQEQDGKIYTTMRKVDIFRYWKSTFTLGSQTFSICDNFKSFFSEPEYNKINATISRTLWNLKDKGLITLMGRGGGGRMLNFGAMTDDLGNLSQDEYVKKKLSEGPITSDLVVVNTFAGPMSVPKEWTTYHDAIPIELAKGCGSNIRFVTLTDEGIKLSKLLKVKSAQTTQLNNKGGI